MNSRRQVIKTYLRYLALIAFLMTALIAEVGHAEQLRYEELKQVIAKQVFNPLGLDAHAAAGRPGDAREDTGKQLWYLDGNEVMRMYLMGQAFSRWGTRLRLCVGPSASIRPPSA